MSDKNRDREAPSFANINMLGKCNAKCFFCLGEDIPELLGKCDKMRWHFSQWPNLVGFLRMCHDAGINKIYLTGQNTDPLLYQYLPQLIEFIQSSGFLVGIRTNGYLAMDKMDSIHLCKEEIGYSIHSINPLTNQMILGRSDIPDWETILPVSREEGREIRVSVVINRCNYAEFWGLMRYLEQFNLPYVQIRRVSTDTRQESLAPDINAYETLYTEVSRMFPICVRRT